MPYKDKQKGREKHKEWRFSQSGRTKDWKRHGILIYDEDTLYRRYIQTDKCELCNVTLESGAKSKVRKCLDHDHLSGYPRFVCCNKCNRLLGVIDLHRLKLHLELHRYFHRA